MASIPDFTVVLGLDDKHLRQLALTWQTWKRHKPSLLQRPFVAFYDSGTMDPAQCEAFAGEIYRLIGSDVALDIVPWPIRGVDYGNGTTKWDNPQRHKMLAGFLHIPARHVATPYFLKLDTDAIATGMDQWIDSEWFENYPAIVAPPFGYTKPPYQMMKLDAWVLHAGLLQRTAPLNLVPEPNATLLRHPRICGWCDFFNMRFIRECADAATSTVGPYKLPEPSLDGFTWYVAKRTSRCIRTVNMKSRGWDVRNSMAGIEESVGKALA